MAISTIGETSHGTFEEIMADLRRLNDEYGIAHINVTFKKPKKPLLTLVTRREDYADSTGGL